MEIGIILGAIGIGIPVLCLAAICVACTIKMIQELIK